jgi:hypothetical protein
MGMYDNICIKVICPICGREVDNFQTKDTECMLDYIMPGEDKADPKMRYLNTYAICEHIKKTASFGEHTYDTGAGHVWIDVQIPVETDGLLSGDTDKYIITTTDHLSGWERLKDDPPLSETAKKFNRETEELIAKGPYKAQVILDKELYQSHIDAEAKYVQKIMDEIDEKNKAIEVYCKERKIVPTCDNCVHKQGNKCDVYVLNDEAAGFPLAAEHGQSFCTDWVEKDIKTEW